MVKINSNNYQQFKNQNQKIIIVKELLQIKFLWIKIKVLYRKDRMNKINFKL